MKRTFNSLCHRMVGPLTNPAIAVAMMAGLIENGSLSGKGKNALNAKSTARSSINAFLECHSS